MPPEHTRHGKELETKIFQEHRKLQGMTELNAKFRYVQLCRSLKTYGVTFFLIKEKVPKKNKMVDILLGITRDSVMRMDAETKVRGCPYAWAGGGARTQGWSEGRSEGGRGGGAGAGGEGPERGRGRGEGGPSGAR